MGKGNIDEHTRLVSERNRTVSTHKRAAAVYGSQGTRGCSRLGITAEDTEFVRSSSL